MSFAQTISPKYTVESRRLHDLQESISADVAGAQPLSSTDKIMIAQASALILESERPSIDVRTQLRIANSVEKILGRLSARRSPSISAVAAE